MPKRVIICEEAIKHAVKILTHAGARDMLAVKLTTHIVLFKLLVVGCFTSTEDHPLLLNFHLNDLYWHFLVDIVFHVVNLQVTNMVTFQSSTASGFENSNWLRDNGMR